jgi:urease accessory protein
MSTSTVLKTASIRISMASVIATELASLQWLLALLRLASPTLPIGAYAYSRGLEYAVHAGWVHDETSAQSWLLGLLQHTAARLDGPIFLRLYRALQQADLPALEHWNARLLASRESAELRLEDTQLGAALARLLAAQGVAAAQPWAARADACYATLFALAALHFEIASAPALLAFLWASTESQVSAALRLIPLGQTAGQRILSQLVRSLPPCAAEASALEDDEIGALAPGFALASALHETQYTRLFRS